MDCTVLLILVIASLASTVTSHKCYVCAPDSGKVEDIEQLKKYFPSTAIPACSQYKPHLKDQYLLECPPTLSKGCLTKFEVTHGVTRTCARLAIDDCPIANSIQYCYCKNEGCNSPDNTLSAVLPTKDKLESEKKSSSGLGSASPGHSPPVFASQFPTGGHFSDDEDEGEGSADHPAFYYDEYYEYGEETFSGIRLEGPEFGNLGFHPHDDTEGGEEDAINEDVTNPPPYLDLGETDMYGQDVFQPFNEEKNDRINPKFEWGEKETVARENDEIKFEEEEAGRGKNRVSDNDRGRTASGCVAPSCCYSLLLLLLLLSSCHPRTYRSL